MKKMKLRAGLSRNDRRVTTPLAGALAALFLAIVLGAGAARAAEPHRLELGLTGGYRIGGQFDLDTGNLGFDETPVIGADIGWRASPDVVLSLDWFHQSTSLQYQPLEFEPTVEVGDMAINTFHFSGVYEHGVGKVHPYAGVGAGATLYSPEPAGFEDEVRFSFNLQGGLRTDVSDRVSFKFGALGLFTNPPDDNTVLECPSPTFCYEQAGTSLITQFQFTAGIVVRP